MSSMWRSASRTSNIPAPTEWRYAMAQTSLMTDSTSPPPHASSRSSHLSVRTERVMPMTVSRSRLPPPSLYTSRIPSMTSITTAFS